MKAAALFVLFEEKEQRTRLLQDEVQKKSSEYFQLLDVNSDLRTALAQNKTELEQSKLNAEQRLAELRDAKTRLSETFAALSADALRKNNETFLQIAKETMAHFQTSSTEQFKEREQSMKTIVSPLKESLEKVDAKVRELEAAREGAYRGLHQQIHALLESQNLLRKETENLAKALHAPTSRGRWGEMQLRRVVELAGMLSHCDFYEQTGVSASDEAGVRPDMVIRLPGNKCVVVDAKVPLTAYLQAVDEPDEQRRSAALKEHADQLRRHVQILGKKAYWKRFEPSPEFVVLFLPGEIFFSAALASDPELIENGVQQGVIIATPTTLIALLRAVSYGWRQEALAENAQKISQLAHKLVERIHKMNAHFQKLGKSLGASVDSYNQTLGSMETRVLSVARKLTDLGGPDAQKELAMLEPVESIPRALIAFSQEGEEEPADEIN